MIFSNRLFTDSLILSAWFFITLPSTCHAYLDPGSGNALIYLAISLFGAVVYGAKKVFYRLFGGVDASQQTAKNGARILIFSEGQNYWQTYRPIIEALLKKAIPFKYITMDVRDPALRIDDPLMDSRYIGKGTAAFVKVSNAQADIMLTTTTNIGTPGHPVARSRKVKQLVHVYHAVGGTELYRRGGLDHFDTVFMSGDFDAATINLLAEKHNLAPKRLITTGAPYLDSLAATMPAELPVHNAERPTVLIAPSWGTRNLFYKYGTDFVKLLAADFDVIIRPHPQSRTAEPEYLQSLADELADMPNVRWDNEVDGTPSLAAADLMITARSGVAMDFALLYHRPVLTLALPFPSPEEYDYIDVADEIDLQYYERDTGMLLEPANDEEIVRAAKEMIASNANRDYQAIEKKYLPYFRKSGERIADSLAMLLDEMDTGMAAAAQ